MSLHLRSWLLIHDNSHGFVQNSSSMISVRYIDKGPGHLQRTRSTLQLMLAPKFDLNAAEVACRCVLGGCYLRGSHSHENRRNNGDCAVVSLPSSQASSHC